MPRTILSVAYPFTEAGDDAVGGSEQILTLLDRAITDAGHHSIVIAAEGSRIRGTLVPSPTAQGRLDDNVRAWGQRVHRQLIAETLAKCPVDLIHMHSLDFHAYIPAGNTPVLATLHLPPDWYPESVYWIRRKNLHLVCVSESQYMNCPPCGDLLLPPIRNGVDVDGLQPRFQKRSFALALGRICPEKGYHFALDACREAGVKMLLAGEVFPYETHRQYHRKEVLPRLDRDRRFIGPVGFRGKARLLSQACCLLIPSTVAETSSLVAMEALACGTPVIAFGSGALPETVEHGRTGFIVSDQHEMAAALRRLHEIDPAVCRATAKSLYSAREMGRRYLQVYEDLIRRAAPEASRLKEMRAR